MAEIGDLLVNDINNVARWPEGMFAPDVNGAGRADEGILARWFKDTNFSLISSGSNTAFTLLTNRATPALADVGVVCWRAHIESDGTSLTLKVNDLAAKPLVGQGNRAMTDAVIKVNQCVMSVYNSAIDKFECIGIEG